MPGSIPGIPIAGIVLPIKMSQDQSNRTEYTDDALIASSEMDAQDIRTFLVRRAREPYEIEGVTIWSFNNHELHEAQLAEQAESFKSDEYIIPYQVPGIWGYMYRLLPKDMREIEILTYSTRDGKYYAFPNYDYYSKDNKNDETRERIREFLDSR